MGHLSRNYTDARFLAGAQLLSSPGPLFIGPQRTNLISLNTTPSSRQNAFGVAASGRPAFAVSALPSIGMLPPNSVLAISVAAGNGKLGLMPDQEDKHVAKWST